MGGVLSDAVNRSVGSEAATLKGEKRTGLKVHARAGLPCPVCGDAVAEVSFADQVVPVLPDLPDGGSRTRRPTAVQATQVSGHR